MYVARLICSDEACAAEVAAEAGTLRELETLVCDCGCALELIGWPDSVDEPVAEVITLRVRAVAAGLCEAAWAPLQLRSRAPWRECAWVDA